MRTLVEILADFDNPDGAVVTLPLVDSKTSSVRERVVLEALLDIRDWSIGIPAVYNTTTACHIIEIVAEKVPSTMGVIAYRDNDGVLIYDTDLTKFVVSV